MAYGHGAGPAAEGPGRHGEPLGVEAVRCEGPGTATAAWHCAQQAVPVAHPESRELGGAEGVARRRDGIGADRRRLDEVGDTLHREELGVGCHGPHEM